MVEDLASTNSFAFTMIVVNLLLHRYGRTLGLLILLWHGPHPHYVVAKILTDRLSAASSGTTADEAAAGELAEMGCGHGACQGVEAGSTDQQWVSRHKSCRHEGKGFCMVRRIAALV